MDISSFTNAAVQGVPLIAFIIGLVQFIKGFGVEGKALRATSMGVGLVLGAGYQIAVAGPPATFAGGFGVAVYGLALGLVASGVYDAGTAAVKAALAPPKE